MLNPISSVASILMAIMLIAPVHAQNLEETYRQVLQSDPRLLIDTIGVEVGSARERQALASLLPQVSASSNWTENDRQTGGSMKHNYNGERYILSVQQSLFNLPQYYNWRKSQTRTNQFISQKSDTHSLVRLDTIERYFNVLSKSDQLALIREEKNATEKKVEQTRALYKRQLVKATDFYEVEARLDRLASEEIDAMQELDLAKEGLNELTNNTIDKVSPLTLSADFIEKVDDIDQWISNTIANNTSLKVLKQAIDASQQNIKEQVSGHYPVLSLQLTKQKSDIGFENSLAPKSETGTASLNLTVPIYSGGQTSARVYEARQQLLLAQAEYDKERRKLLKDLRDHYLSVNALVRRTQAAIKAVESAEKSYAEMNKSFELGMTTVSDVLVAQQAFSQAKRDHQQARYDYIVSKARLYYVAGQLDDDVFYKISNWLM